MSNKVTQPCSHLSDTCLQQGGPTLVTFERHLSSTRWPNLGRIWANPCLQRGGPSLVTSARNMSLTIVAQPWPHLTETCFQQYRTTLVTERNMSSASKMANLVNICAEPVFSQQGDPTLAAFGRNLSPTRWSNPTSPPTNGARCTSSCAGLIRESWRHPEVFPGGPPPQY